MGNAIVALYSVCWTEIEPGWGQRPDGYSFHKSVEDANAFIKKTNQSFANKGLLDYSVAEKPKLVEVSKSLSNYVMKNGCVWLGLNNLEAYKKFDAKTLVKKE